MTDPRQCRGNDIKIRLAPDNSIFVYARHKLLKREGLPGTLSRPGVSMLPLLRFALLILTLVQVSGSLWAQAWVNDQLLHRTPSYTADGADSCLTCHSGEKMHALLDSVHGTSEHPRSPAVLNQCETCHGPGSIHVSRAHGGKGFPSLTVFGYGRDAAAREEQLDVCMSCHGDGGDGLKAVVFEGTVHDRMIINCSACHQVHAESDPVLERSGQPDVCFKCHLKQKEEHPKTGSRVPDFDRMGCAGCHRPHRLPRASGSGATP